MIAAWERPLVAALVFLALALLIYRMWRRGRIGLTVLAVTAVIAAAWILARAAVRADYRDADGYVDCWPTCSALQDAVGLAIWYGPLLSIILGAFAAVLAAITRPRGRQSNLGSGQ